MEKPLLISLAAGLALAMAFTLSCSGGGGNNPSSLVGKWKHASGAMHNKPNDIELFKDGTGVADNIAISWKVENKRLVVVSSMLGFSCNYKVSGYELALACDDGDNTTFLRKEKLEEFEAKQAAVAEAERTKQVTEMAKRAVEIAKQVAVCANKGYKTVKIGSQIWMAENFNCNVSGSKCYDDDEANCNKYGRLYDWETAMVVCPSGWHLPTNVDWDKLYRFVDGTTGTASPYKSPTAGKKLKFTNGWNNYEGKSGNGMDEFGFAALPGGYSYSEDRFLYAGYHGGWWSASDGGVNDAYDRYMSYNSEVAGWDSDYKGFLFSVRCVK